MPYQNRDELPDAVQSALSNVPHAQTIYLEAYNNAWEQYADPADRQGDRDREATAHAVAWAAVKGQYQQAEDESWHPREH
jgi:cation transport regulator